MDRHESFSEGVAAKLGRYVYRLIDPREGTTFYVGRGQGNRVFSHAAGQEKPSSPEDNESLKLKMIWEIKETGLQVEHVIHRHGLSEDAVGEVESALIDAYPGLTNIQAGSDSERGVMHAEEVIRLYEAPQAVFQHKVLLINVNRTGGDQDPYEAVRYAWKISPEKAGKADFVLAVRRDLIIEVFKVQGKWLAANPENFAGRPLREGRYGFNGSRAPEDIRDLYRSKRVPEELKKKGAANPIRYIGL